MLEMFASHPLATGCLLEPHTCEPLAMSEAIERGWETLRACLLNEAPTPDAFMLMPTLLYLATGQEDPHAALASRPLYDELVDEGVDLSGWVEPLEALREEMADAARDFLAQSTNGSPPAHYRFASGDEPDEDCSEPLAVARDENKADAESHGLKITEHGDGRRTVTGPPEDLNRWFIESNKRLMQAQEPGASKLVRTASRLPARTTSAPTTPVAAVARSSTGNTRSPSSRRTRTSRGSPARLSGSGDDDLPHERPLARLGRALARLLLGGRR